MNLFVFTVSGTKDNVTTDVVCKVHDFGSSMRKLEKGAFVFKYSSALVKVHPSDDLKNLFNENDYRYFEWKIEHDNQLIRKGLILKNSNSVQLVNNQFSLRCDGALKLMELNITRGISFDNRTLKSVVEELFERSGLSAQIEISEIIATTDTYVRTFVDILNFTSQIAPGLNNKYYFLYDSGLYETSETGFSGLIKNSIEVTSASNRGLNNVGAYHLNIAPKTYLMYRESQNHHQNYSNPEMDQIFFINTDFFELPSPSKPVSYEAFIGLKYENGIPRSSYNLNTNNSYPMSASFFIKGYQEFACLIPCYHFRTDDYFNPTDINFKMIWIKNSNSSMTSFTWDEAYNDKLFEIPGETYVPENIFDIQIQLLFEEITDNPTSNIKNAQFITQICYYNEDSGFNENKIYLFQFSSNHDKTTGIETHNLSWLGSYDKEYDDRIIIQSIQKIDGKYHALKYDGSELQHVIFENLLSLGLTFTEQSSESIHSVDASVTDEFDKGLLPKVVSVKNTSKDEFLYVIALDEIHETENMMAYTMSKNIYSFLESYTAQRTALETIIDLSKLFNCVIAQGNTDIIFKSRDSYFNSTPVLEIINYHYLKEDFLPDSFDFVKINAGNSEITYPVYTNEEIEDLDLKGLQLSVKHTISLTYLNYLAENLYGFFAKFQYTKTIKTNMKRYPILNTINLLDVILFKGKKHVIIELKPNRISQECELKLLEENND